MRGQFSCCSIQSKRTSVCPLMSSCQWCRADAPAPVRSMATSRAAPVPEPRVRPPAFRGAAVGRPAGVRTCGSGRRRGSRGASVGRPAGVRTVQTCRHREQRTRRSRPASAASSTRNLAPHDGQEMIIGIPGGDQAGPRGASASPTRAALRRRCGWSHLGGFGADDKKPRGRARAGRRRPAPPPVRARRP